MILYQLNENDIITHIEGDWDNFALDNQAEDLLINNTLGNSLWRFIQSDTKYIYQYFVGQVRQHNNRYNFNINCDSLYVRREMNVNIEKVGKTVVFTSELIAEENRDSQLYQSSIKFNPFGQPLFICSFCNLAALKRDKPFRDLEDLVKQGIFNNTHNLITRINCVCQDCKKKLNLHKIHSSVFGSFDIPTHLKEGDSQSED